MGVALYKYILRYNPTDSKWFDRDRFILSDGEFDLRPHLPLFKARLG